MQKLYVIILCVFVFITTANFSQEKVIQNIIELGRNENQTMDHLDILSNRFGGRPIGSDAYDNAADWVVHKFSEWGLEVHLDEAGELPVGFNRGPWFGRMLSHNGMNLHFATPSYTSGTKGVQRGHVVLEPKSQAEFDKMKGKLKGAWVLIGGTNDGYPIDISENANLYRDSIIAENKKITNKNAEIRKHNWEVRSSGKGEKKEELPYIDEPGLFYKEMKESGILGIIQSSKLPIRVMYDRKNIMDMSFENLPSIPDIKLDEHQYKIIERMVKERQTFELEFDIRNHFKMGPVKYHNVIGMIKGTEFPDEYVIAGGHLDSYDVATGGVDDGTGASSSMEVARLLMKSGAKPKRTILICLWAGEEFGLLGSKNWVKRNPEKLNMISNMFNRDGGPLAATSISVPEAMWEDFAKICEPLNSINSDFPFTLKKREPAIKPTEPKWTDSGSFNVHGIPTLSFGEEDVKGYDFYYREIWHTERDTYDKSIPEYMEHTATVTAVVVLGVANLDHLLDRSGLYLPEEK